MSDKGVWKDRSTSYSATEAGLASSIGRSANRARMKMNGRIGPLNGGFQGHNPSTASPEG